MRSSSENPSSTENAAAPRVERTSSKHKSFDHGQRRQIVTQQLLSDIVHGRISAGTRLVIKHLAERYDVSPTPIREALVSLEGIGVVHVSPNRGAIVRKITAADAQEIFQVRKVLEAEAARLASGRIAAEALTALRSEFQNLDQPGEPAEQRSRRARDADGRLHDLIAAECGNRYLKQEIDRLAILFRAFRDVAWHHQLYREDPSRFTAETIEHLAIIEALATGDGEAAAEAMRRHIEAGAKYWSWAVPIG